MSVAGGRGRAEKMLPKALPAGGPSSAAVATCRGRVSACELEGRLRRKSLRLPEGARRSGSAVAKNLEAAALGDGGAFPARGTGWWGRACG